MVPGEKEAMYEVVDERLDCDQHGRRVRAAIHLYMENGDLSDPENTWMVCLSCAHRMDRDPKFKASKRAAFEKYQRHVRQLLRKTQ